MAAMMEGRRVRPSTSAVARAVNPDSSNYEVIKSLVISRYQHNLGINLNQDVKNYQDVPEKRVMPYRVRRLVSPFEFYLEFANVPEPYIYKNWFGEMQAFYEDETNRKYLKLIHGVPIPGRCYACCDFKDQKWHRVRLHHVRKETGTLMVFYLDLGKMQETTVDRLLELEPKFSLAPAQVFRCHLADVFPAASKETLRWSSDACLFFEGLVTDKEFLGVVLTRSTTRVSRKMPDYFTNFDILLVEAFEGTRIPKPNTCTINAQMVEAGFAVATGVGAGCRHFTEIEEFVPYFDPSEFDMLLGICPPKGQPASESIYIPHFEYIEELEAREAMIREADADAGALQEAENGVDRMSYESIYKNATNEFPSDFASRMVGAKPAFILDPSSIIFHLKSRMAELGEMTERIRMLVEGKESLHGGRPGMLVACQILDSSGRDRRNQSKTIWCRGIIKTIVWTEVESYRILMTDYGNEMSLDPDHVRRLPSCFQEYPSFAVRAHMDVEGLRPNELNGWSMKAEMDFRRYVYAWEAEKPNYYIYRPRHAQIFELENYGQKIRYDSQEGKWCLSQGMRQATNQIVNEMKNHPMIHSLFVSIGVDILQESNAPDAKMWNFERLSDLLASTAGEFGKKQLGTVKNGRTCHREITEAASSCKIERSPFYYRETGDNRNRVRRFAAGRGIRNRNKERQYEQFYD